MIDSSEQYSRASSRFDRVAVTYDTLYGAEAQNALVRWMKAENMARLEATFPPGSRLLELGCGTGEDAVHLAAAGRSVLATDISPAMIAATQRRAEAGGVADRLTARVAAASDAAALARESAEQNLDGAYSCFTLMYEPNMQAVGDGLAQLLRPGAPLLLSVLSRTCLWETLWLLLHLHPRGAFRRWRDWGQTQIGAGEKLPGRHYSPRSLERALQPHFRLESARALLLAWPPPFLERVYLKRPRFFERLLPLERTLRDRRPFNGWGYAFAAVLRKAQ